MAAFCNLTSAWDEWVQTRPIPVQEVCQRWPANLVYRLKTTGQRGSIMAYAEDGTVRLFFPAEWNPMATDVQVFSINPNDLEECDLPEEVHTFALLERINLASEE